MTPLLRILRFWFIGPEFASPWTAFTATATLFITGAAVKTGLPDSTAAPIVCALATCGLAAWLIHRWENRPQRNARRRSLRQYRVEILSDPSQR